MIDLSKSYEYFQPEKNNGKIHIIGCGSVGSVVAENIARAGITKFVLWDFDKVESHNLANQMFVRKHIGKLKTDALLEILEDINPEIKHHAKTKPKGWNGEALSGYVFMCVDDIDVRRQIVESQMHNTQIKALFDFRTGLEDAQHYAADWSDEKMKNDLLATMDFTNEEAEAATPVSACNIALSVAPTVRVICALGVANFMNVWNGREIKKMILSNSFQFAIDVF